MSNILPKSAVILDIDGTLIDIRQALPLILCDTPDFTAFYNKTVECPAFPEAIVFAEKYHHQGYELLIFTARSQSRRLVTEKWLQKNFPLPYQLFMKPCNDYPGDIAVKQQELDIARNFGYNPQYAIDDTWELLDLWQSHGITVTPMPLLRKLDGTYPISGDHYSNSCEDSIKPLMDLLKTV